MREFLGRLVRAVAQVAIGMGALFSRFLNAMLYRGSMRQSLSARAFVEAATDSRWERRMKRIDALFFWESDHCYAAWLDEVDRARRTLALNRRLNGETRDN